MYSDKLQLSLVNNTQIKNAIDDTHFAQGQAGFVKDGNYAWIVHDSTLEILSTETGVKIAHYNFSKYHGARGCVITCVEEIDYLPGICILAVAIEFTTSGASAGMLSIFCVQGSKILGSMDFCERITCCRYIEKAACERSVLCNFKGTIAIGTDQGKLFLIDLLIPSNSHEISSSISYESELFPCLNILANVEQTQIATSHKKTTAAAQQVREKTFFSVQLEVLNDSTAVLSILSLPNLFTMAVGLNDGRMVFYDLHDLQAFHLAYPPFKRAPLTHMSFLEPSDDPKCAVYVWAFHSSPEGAIAVMHSLMFATQSEGIYEDFKTCCSRLTMPMHVKDTFPICCRSITRALAQDEEDVLTLNILAWTAPATRRTNIMIFDLNQWYKEEMPSIGDWRLKLKYVSVFELNSCTALDVIVNENSVFPFNSIMRPEEHFYPNSLSFDVSLLENDKFAHMRWYGIQNIVLQQFNVIGPQIILEPSYYFNELLQVAILPQFSDVAYNVTTPTHLKREFLLSVALEYNFNGFLKKCAWAWADGSYLGKDNSVGIGLSTLTDWIWNRVRDIKEVCNVLCKPLFDFSEQRIDYGTQKQLSQCCKQLKVLSELLIIVLREYKQFIPEHVLVQLKTQSETIKMASDYQEVLQWLLNVGLLPEGHYDPKQSLHDIAEEFLIVPYPYQVIKSHYEAQRMKLADEWMGEAKYLFIDAFIEHECNAKKLREVWGGSYPPRSIQALLRTLLVPEISLQSKHVIFVYLFMDITNVLKDGTYSSIVRNLIKFPAVFRMNPAIIKRTQAFWNLDNGNLDTAVEELISPLSHDKHIPLWQRELLIGTLLKQKANSLALRSLRCPGNQISPDLEMFALLASNLMSEALKVQRASGDRQLLVKLFEKILHSPNYELLLDLSLTEEEGVVLREYLQGLKDTGLPNHLNIHFVFLLQRSKFLDAAQLVESMNESNVNMEPPKQVLNAYYASMESTTRKLTSMVYTDEVQVKESPQPLSVNLIQARCNAKNDIYQKCVQSINEAAYENSQDNQSLPFIGSPRLGIFEYRQSPMNHLHDVTYALEVNEHGKRKQVQKGEDPFIRLEDLQAPQQKKRKLNQPSAVKRKSYMDMRTNNLTVFKDTKPNYSFTKKSPGNSLRTSPDRVHAFGNFLNTPIIEKKTPPNKVCPPTPHSILKTRSRCGSISPAPSRFSEFNDDNKSVKSITFAALPDSRDTSLNGSFMLEESFNEEEGKLESSVENFYSPGKSPEAKTSIAKVESFLEGPKARKSIKSRSTTPVDPMEVVEPAVEVNTQEVSEELQNRERLNSSDVSEDYAKPFRDGSVLKDNSTDNDSDEASDSSAPDKSIYNYVRRSVLPDNYGELSDSSDDEAKKEKPEKVEENSEDSEMVNDEHFEEEELPEHSDYSDSSEGGENGAEYEYGELELNDSDESSSRESSPPKPKSNDEVICLDSSSDDDKSTDKPPVLPSFNALGSPQDVPTTSVDSLAQEMFSTIYENLEREEKVEGGDDEIESPPYEQLSPSKLKQTILTREEIEAGPGGFSLMTSSQETVLLTQEKEEDEEEVVNEIVEVVVGTSEIMQVVIDPTTQDDNQNVSSSSTKVEFKVPDSANVSAISEECSFVSASGGELNEAIMMSEITVEQSVEVTSCDVEDVVVETTVASDSKNIDEDSNEDFKNSSQTPSEITNVLDQAQIADSEMSMETAQENVTIDEPSTPNQLDIAQIEADSENGFLGFPTEATPREMRGRSMPGSESSSPKSRSTRASTEDREKPKNLRKTKVLKRIEETGSPAPSPGRLTRRRSQLQLLEESETTPQTPTRMTRRKSLLIEDAPTTPTRRMTRAASKESVAHSESDKTPDEPANLTRQRSLRNRTTSASDNDDAKSTKSTRSTRKKSMTPTSSLKVTPDSSPVEAAEPASLTNRRLTRQQMQVIEKSRLLAERMASGSALRPTKSEDLHAHHDNDSDNESVKSDSGSVASSRASRKRKAPKRFNASQEDSSSVASKSSRRSTSPGNKWNQLSIIPEESVAEESSEASSSKRVRKAKK